MGTAFRDCTVTALDISGGNWAYTVLRGVSLHKGDLTGVKFDGADLSGCDLSGANFTGGSMREVQLSGADLRDADLRGCDLWGTDLAAAKAYRGARIDLSEAVRLAEQRGFQVEV